MLFIWQPDPLSLSVQRSHLRNVLILDDMDGKHFYAISYNIYSTGSYRLCLLVTHINGEALTESVAMSGLASQNENIHLRALGGETPWIGTAVILVEQVFCILSKAKVRPSLLEVFFSPRQKCSC